MLKDIHSAARRGFGNSVGDALFFEPTLSHYEVRGHRAAVVVFFQI